MRETYTPAQWILFFYIYCFIGWVWESCYVSVKEKHLVNRGFMKGPCLPIYGSGGTMLLIIALFLKDNYLLTAIVSVVAADTMEYITGAAMEAIFRVRYWDYSNEKYNLNGHICLKSSICWIVMAYLLVYVIQPAIEVPVLRIPEQTEECLVLAFSAVAFFDFATSFKTALDLRGLLIRAEGLYDELREIQERIDGMHKKLTSATSLNVRQTRDELQEMIDRLYSKAAETMQLAKERAAGTALAVKDRAAGTALAVKDRAAGTALAVKDRAAGTALAVKDRAAVTALAVKDRATDAALVVRDRAADTALAVKEHAADTALAVKEKAAGTVQLMKDKTIGTTLSAKERASGPVRKVKGFASGSVLAARENTARSMQTVKEKALGSVQTVRYRAAGSVRAIRGKMSGAVLSMKYKVLDMEEEREIALTEEEILQLRNDMEILQSRKKTGNEILSGYSDSMRHLLKRNPGAVSRVYQRAFEEMKRQMENREKRAGADAESRSEADAESRNDADSESRT